VLGDKWRDYVMYCLLWMYFVVVGYQQIVISESIIELGVGIVFFVIGVGLIIASLREAYIMRKNEKEYNKVFGEIEQELGYM